MPVAYECGCGCDLSVDDDCLWLWLRFVSVTVECGWCALQLWLWGSTPMADGSSSGVSAADATPEPDDRPVSPTRSPSAYGEDSGKTSRAKKDVSAPAASGVTYLQLCFVWLVVCSCTVCCFIHADSPA